MQIIDDSFKWVPKVIKPEIKRAIDRALRAGAEPPLSYMGAGQFGIVVCDRNSLAFKIGRHHSRSFGAHLNEETNQSLYEEFIWFEFAAQMPFRKHVAKVFDYDDRENILVRECVTAREQPYRYGNELRLISLINYMGSSMRPYGFRTPEYKPDAFVYHRRRGPVLVDAGFGARDIGWVNARRGVELLAGTKPLNSHERRDVVHGLRMDAGKDLPEDLALDLADRLEKLI